jgi:hypothetical protein
MCAAAAAGTRLPDIDELARLSKGADVTEGSPASAVGGIHTRQPFWQAICTSSWAQQWVREGFPLRWASAGLPPPPAAYPNRAGAREHAGFVSSCIAEQLEAGAILRWPHKPRVVNPINVVPKKSGKLRLILDLSLGVNPFVYSPSFKYERLRDLDQVAHRGARLMAVDLVNGYWQVRMHPEAYEYLGFEWEGQFYVFAVLPFGLSTAPWCFTVLMRYFSAHLRAQGVALINYLDDFLFALDPDMLVAQRQRASILAAFEQAGLAINCEKSQLNLLTDAECLGFCVDTAAGTFTIPVTRWNKFQALVREALRAPTIPARTLSSVLGHVSSMSLVLGGLARLFSRSCFALVNSRAAWDAPLVLDDAARHELLFWGSLQREALTAPIWRPAEVSHLRVSTDASDFAWAGVLGSAVARGFLTLAERALSSGARELIAIRNSLLSFSPESLRGRRVHLVTDSQNAVAVTDHGSTKPHMQALALEIFWLCRSLDVQLHVTWIPRELNTVADFFSKLPDGNDWQLNPLWFRVLDAKWGPHAVDRFATHLNKLCARFNSLYFCPGCEGVNAFAQDWRNTNNWCNPPFHLLGRVWHLLAAQRAVATLIVPVWPAAVWWPLFNPSPGRFAQAVVGAFALPHKQPDLFRPGQLTANASHVGPPHWRVWAVRVDFSADPLTLAQRTPLPLPEPAVAPL